MSITLLAIESSCDDTSAALLRDGRVLSNILANQTVHSQYGGVVPELASRAHQQNIVPVVEAALKEGDVTLDELDFIAFTRGPGLLGSLIVGSSFAKGLAMGLNIPLVDVNHLQGHLLSPFLLEMGEERELPTFPYLSLLVSGGHTQIARVDSPLQYTVLGKTIDDAAGEAFDKCAKLLELGYPGGPIVDRLAESGNPKRFSFAKPNVKELDFSFSGLKTSLLYFLRDQLKEDPNFISENLEDIAASFRERVVEILVEKLIVAAEREQIHQITTTGGVAANSLLRRRLEEECKLRGWNLFLPKLSYTTDNAAMIGIAAYHRFLAGVRAADDAAPLSRVADF